MYGISGLDPFGAFHAAALVSLSYVGAMLPR